MRQYEITYLISDNVPESDLNKVTGKVGGYVRDLGGKMLKEEVWGRRKLAYPILKQDFATYVTINFDLPASKAIELERNLKLTSKVIRHLMIVKDFGEEELTLTKEDIAETEEIEKVVGGEKSFEAVLGETDESKDLMAKREKEEESEIAEETKSESVEKTEEEKVEKVVAEKAPVEAKEKKAAKNKKEGSAAKSGKEKKNPENEADRLSKLDKELDDILGEKL